MNLLRNQEYLQRANSLKEQNKIQSKLTGKFCACSENPAGVTTKHLRVNERILQVLGVSAW